MPASTSPSGLEAAFLANRERLLRFLIARGAGESAEDLLHELWLKVSVARTGPVASPLSYLFRAADTLMIDRYRAERQAKKRERDWTGAAGGELPGISEAPASDRVLIGREHARLVADALDSLGPRAARVFRLHRIEGVAQRRIAEEIGVSLSTVESDLRAAYRAISDLRERFDEV